VALALKPWRQKLLGQTLAHYEITGLLGKGAMGEVYSARDTRLGRDVALKFLPPEFAADPDRLARFRNEAKVLAALNHANIASIFGLEEIDGKIFLAMELVDGQDLTERVLDSQLTLDEVLELARQFAEGLEAAHARGIVHRDLKPANLRITAEGQLKILDFGLARAYGESPGTISGSLDTPTLTAAMTQQGTILGTVAYMSPEQARGQTVDHRADIWSFGAILHEMLSGVRLFTGETASDTMAAVLRAELDFKHLPDDTPEGLKRLLRRCLERDARRRLRDIGEARVRLERWRENPESIHDAGSVLGSDIRPSARRGAQLPWLVAAIAVCAAAFLGWQLTRQKPAVDRLVDWSIEVTGEDDIDHTGGLNVLISPDGHWYGWLTPAGIHLRRTDSREVRLLPETRDAGAACFSPDNRWIAFATPDGLFRIGVAGGSPFRLCAAPLARGVAWVDENTIVLADAIVTGLKSVDVNTGEMTAISQPDSTLSERSHRWPSAVPGKRGVLFECQYLGRDYDTSDIQYLDLDTGQRHTVHRGGALPVARASGHLLFVRDQTIYTRRLDLGSMEAHGLPLAVRDGVATSVGNQEDDDGSAQYTLDDQGTLFYLDMMGGGREQTRLAWLDYADGHLEPFTDYADYGIFRISPDGKKLIANMQRDGDRNLYVIDLEAGTDLLLTNRTGVEYAGAWSPDSRRFYWTQAATDGTRFEIWSRLVDGTEPATHVASPPSRGGVWVSTISPDSRWLGGVLFAGGDRNDLYLVDLESDDLSVMPFANSTEGENEIGFMGDNSHVIYGQGANGASQAFIRRFPDTGAVWSLPGTEAGWWSFQWIPSVEGVLAVDERGIFRLPVTLHEGGVSIGSALQIYDPNTNPLHRLITDLEFHPDGKRAIVLMREGGDDEIAKPSLVVVTGWERDMVRRMQEMEN